MVRTHRRAGVMPLAALALRRLALAAAAVILPVALPVNISGLPGTAPLPGLGLAHAQGADARVAWHTADTPHFRVHYRQGQRAQAEAVARAAERAFPRVTEALSWTPSARTELAVLSEFDVPNGWASPIPYNHMAVYLTPPDQGELLNNSAWLDMLLVHELTHIVHMDKVRSAPKVLQHIFGRLPWFVPNLFNPGWVLEGLATWHESDAAAGQGRLHGPYFEAWLRAQRKQGFISLAELNADGRAMPVSKQYLYGAYFFEFMARTYGRDKVYAFVEQYSGNIVPRLHSAPWGATGKTMDALWDEFLADLNQRVAARAAPIEGAAEVAGLPIGAPVLEVTSLAALPEGDTLAVVDDGVVAPRLQRLGRDGSSIDLSAVRRGARLDVSPSGHTLLTQADLCDTYTLSQDLYRLEGSRVRQLTRCAHLRRAVSLGRGADAPIAAVQVLAGRTRIVRLNAQGQDTVVLHQPLVGQEVVDIAAAPDGSALSAVLRDGADWRLIRIPLASPGQWRELLRHDAPMHSLRHGVAGLELLVNVDNQANVWRLQESPGAPAQLQRLTHSHTAVLAHGGTAPNGQMVLAVVGAHGTGLRRLNASTPLQTLAAASGAASAFGLRAVPLQAAPAAALVLGPPSAPMAADASRPATTPARATTGAASAPASSSAPAVDTSLGQERGYSALSTLRPRSWFPAITSDRGLTAYGASTSGQDALGWHSYTALAQWETSQRQLTGALDYLYLQRHSLSLERSLVARGWRGASGDEVTTLYDIDTQAQWVSLWPMGSLHRLDRRVLWGLGAAMKRVHREQLEPTVANARVLDERVLAAVARYDSRGANWYSDGANRGIQVQALLESHKPFSADRNDLAPDLDGNVLRLDASGHLPIARGSLALRHTEARASGRTAPFQLGGAIDPGHLIGVGLNQRDIALRGYRGDEPELLGPNARRTTLELRLPLWDVDRHGMVPAVGLNRLAATVFAEMGRTWGDGFTDSGNRRSVGLELRAETKLLFALSLDVRLGVAQALDPVPGGSKTRSYLSVGQAF